jgi:hypothetical protein
MKVRNVERSPQCMAACIMHDDASEIYFYMLLEGWVLASSRFSRMQSYATTLYKENFISIQLLECTSEAQTASMRITSASNLLNAEGRSSSSTRQRQSLCRSIWSRRFSDSRTLNCLVSETCRYYIRRRQWYCSRWTQEGRSSSCCQATAEFVSSDLKRRFSALRTLM